MRKRRAQKKKEVQGEGGVQGPFQEARAPGTGGGAGTGQHREKDNTTAPCN